MQGIAFYIKAIAVMSHKIDRSYITFKTIPNWSIEPSGPGCSKLTTLLVNVLLKFLTLMSQIHQYFFVEKTVRSFCIAKASLIYSTKKYQCIWL